MSEPEAGDRPSLFIVIRWSLPYRVTDSVAGMLHGEPVYVDMDNG
jgi:hypothetical protein